VTFLRLLPAALCGLLMAAHAMRSGWGPVAVVLAALSPLLLLVRRPWMAVAARAALVLAALEWLRSAAAFAAERQAEGRPTLRLWLILGGVAAFQLLAAALISGPRVRGWFSGGAPR